MATPFMKDPHPKVRYAAANTAGQMSTDFGPKLQKKYHQQFVEGLAFLLDDAQNPKYVIVDLSFYVFFCNV